MWIFDLFGVSRKVALIETSAVFGLPSSLLQGLPYALCGQTFNPLLTPRVPGLGLSDLSHFLGLDRFSDK